MYCGEETDILTSRDKRKNICVCLMKTKKWAGFYMKCYHLASDMIRAAMHQYVVHEYILLVS